MTAPTTVAVTIVLAAEDASPYEGVVVTATLDSQDIYTDGFILPKSVSGTTDVNGEVVLALFPNDVTLGLGATGSVYRFVARPSGAPAWHYSAQIPNHACNLADLTDLNAAPVTGFAALLSGSGGAALVGSAAWYASAIVGFDASSVPDGATVNFAGRSAANDGGGGAFYYNATSTATADTATVFAPTGGGRLFRLEFKQTGRIRPEWAGAKCNTKRQSKTVSIASGSAAFSVAQAGTFAAADVGKAILVYGAGVAGAALATTIAAYVSDTAVTLTDTASTTLSASVQFLLWGTDDGAAINAALAALPSGSMLDMSTSASLSYYGTTTAISLPAKPLTMAGSSMGGTVVHALAPIATAVLYRTFGVVYGQRVQDITFDGSKVALPGWVICCMNSVYDQVQFRNGMPHASGVSANFIRGDGSHYGGVENRFYIRTENDADDVSTPFYAGGTDLPSYGVWVRKTTDDWYYSPVCKNNYSINFFVDTDSDNTRLISPHVYGYSGAGNATYQAQYGMQFLSGTHAEGVQIDATGVVAGVDIQSGQCYVRDVRGVEPVDVDRSASWIVQIAASLNRVTVDGVDPGPYKGVNWTLPHGTSTRVKTVMGSSSVGVVSDSGSGNTFGSTANGSAALGSFQTINGSQSAGLSFSGRSDATNVTILGNRPRDWGVAGSLVWQSNGLTSGGSFVRGSAQWRSTQLIGQTVDVTPAVLTVDGAAAAAYNQMVVPTDSGTSWTSTTGGKLIVLARSQDVGRSSAMWEISVLASRAAATVTIVGSSGTGVPAIASAALAACTVAVSADATYKAIAITATGVAGHTIDWWCGPPGMADLMGST